MRLGGFWYPVARTYAILVKELLQMRRDRLTFAMILVIPVMQLIIFGYAINNDPKQLPTAVYAEDRSELTRSLLKAFENSDYFNLVTTSDSQQQSTRLLDSGAVSFVIHFPQGFSQQLVRGQRPEILLEADASDPAAASHAIASVEAIVNRVLAQEMTGPLFDLSPVKSSSQVKVVVHARYNPEGKTEYNIVPGLLGVILTMTSVMITSMAMTREAERGNLENLLAMPTRPYEVMIGKILPYVLMGGVQTLVILSVAHFLFAVPFIGDLTILLLGVLIFVVANLALGFTFSTLARNQMQAMQMTIFFFLPSILLSGFMFPFRGMPDWAQWIGELLPLTHFLRIVRGVMLKGVELTSIAHEFYAILGFILAIGTLAIVRYRSTLD